MINKNQPYFKEWERATDELTRRFTLKYFGKDTEHWWVADEIGGVACINDYFFNIGDMSDFLRYNYTIKAMFEYYDYTMDCYENNKERLNIKTWRHLKK